LPLVHEARVDFVIGIHNVSFGLLKHSMVPVGDHQDGQHNPLHWRLLGNTAVCTRSLCWNQLGTQNSPGIVHESVRPPSIAVLQRLRTLNFKKRTKGGKVMSIVASIKKDVDNVSNSITLVESYPSMHAAAPVGLDSLLQFAFT
jgi:hypothetical protein